MALSIRVARLVSNDDNRTDLCTYPKIQRNGPCVNLPLPVGPASSYNRSGSSQNLGKIPVFSGHTSLTRSTKPLFQSLPHVHASFYVQFSYVFARLDTCSNATQL